MPQRDEQWCRERFIDARVARLATVTPAGEPRVVPIVFAVAGDVIVSAVDHKPKTTVRLRRLANIAANPAVSLLVDAYTEDWTELWWARADGTARVVDSYDMSGLTSRYEQYAGRPPAGPVIVIDVVRWSGWSAT